jgi:hypothetical protein
MHIHTDACARNARSGAGVPQSCNYYSTAEYNYYSTDATDPDACARNARSGAGVPQCQYYYNTVYSRVATTIVLCIVL